MLTAWTVYLKATGDGSLTSAQLDALAGALASRHGAVSGGDARYSVQFEVTADSAVDAVAEAAGLLRTVARDEGIPSWPVVRVEAMTPAEQQRGLDRHPLPPLVGVAEVAELLGVTEERVSMLAREQGDFPAPAVRLASGPVWHEAKVRGFPKRWDRTPGG